MLIQNLDQKIKLAKTAVVTVVVGCVLICGFTFLTAINLVRGEREQIYVLDGDIPFLAQRAQLEANFTMEARAHIALFHNYFFTLPPDDSYIRYSIGKALYMADGSALQQKKALDETGFYSNLVSTSSISSIICDSIQVNEKTLQFTYYGKQTIRRRSTTQIRSMITSGFLESVPRTENNPHGLMITKWRTLENKDLKSIPN